MEVWKEIEDFTNYEVSNMERYKNKTTKKIYNTKELKLDIRSRIRISMKGNDDKDKKMTFSNVVAEAFVPNPENKPMIWHKDRDNTNNKPDNLEWMTRKEINNIKEKPTTKKKHPIVRIDKETKEELEIYESSHAAAEWVLENKTLDVELIGISNCITDVCSGHEPSMYGFKWKYYIEPIEGEEWKKHPTLEHIWCSDKKRVKNRIRLLYGCKDCENYINININNISYKRADLIAQTFIPNPDDKPIVDHKNRNRDDDRPENLRWATPKENTEYAWNKKVYQYSTDRNTFIKEFESVKNAGEQLNIDPKNISACSLGKIKTVGGYYFSYNNPLTEDEKGKELSHSNSKKIYQYSKDKETFIKEFPSAIAASKELGINRQSICACANGIQKSSGGYYWAYNHAIPPSSVPVSSIGRP